MTLLTPYAGKDVPWLLRSHAEARPDSVFLVWEPFEAEPREWTYSQFYSDVRDLAAGLNARGLERGDRLLLHANNCPEFLIIWHACAMLGAVVVTTNPRCAAPEIAYFIEHSNAKAAIVEQTYLDMFESGRSKLDWIAFLPSELGSASCPSPGIIPFDDLPADGLRLSTECLDPMTPLSVQYTSGTTSRPKGVVWTHANALWAGQIGAAHNQLRSEDSGLVFTPLCHTNAMSWGHLPTLWAGGRIVLQPKFSSSRFWPVAVKHRCTWANVIPFGLNALKEMEPPPHNFRHWVVGAANFGGLETHFGLSILGAWGMTETVVHGTFTPPQLPSPARSMGMPAPEYELKIVGPDDAEVQKGETGQLKIRGKRGQSLFLEYLNDPAATAACFDAEGWFDTGDRVYEIDYGHLRFADRAKDMLRVGGENVAASQVEGVILGVPGVREAAVVGRPHAMLDEEPVAFVIATEASEALSQAIINACRAELASFKVPAEVRFMSEFPRAELNKVAKKKLREMLEQA
ncbi:AMP-binding protein [Sphingopyxis sp. 550A]